MKKRLLLFFTICFLLSSAASVLYADSIAPPTPYELVLGDGAYIFYMTPRWLPPAQEVSPERMAIRSGLYYHTDPLVNIYYVDEYFYQGCLFFSSDASSFAHLSWASSYGFLDLGGEAIGFYRNGVKEKSYRVQDLLKNVSRASFSVNHVLWEDWEKREYDEQQSTLCVVSLDGRRYVFDIMTGDTLSKPDDRLVLLVILCVVAAFIALLVTLNLRGAKQRLAVLMRQLKRGCFLLIGIIPPFLWYLYCRRSVFAPSIAQMIPDFVPSLLILAIWFCTGLAWRKVSLPRWAALALLNAPVLFLALFRLHLVLILRVMRMDNELGLLSDLCFSPFSRTVFNLLALYRRWISLHTSVTFFRVAYVVLPFAFMLSASVLGSLVSKRQKSLPTGGDPVASHGGDPLPLQTTAQL